MRKVEPVMAKEQPLLWKQAIRQTEHRGYSKRNILFSAAIEYTFPFKKHLSYRFDHLIIGSNPILTYLLLLKLHDATLTLEDVEPVKIGVLFTNEQDYWAYHALKKEDVWHDLRKYLKQSNNHFSKSFHELLEQRTDLFLDEMRQRLIVIDSSNFSLFNCRYDKYIDGYIMHIGDKKPIAEHSFQSAMPTVLQEEFKLAKQANEEFNQFLKKLSKRNHNALYSLKFPDEKVQCPDNPVPTHILLSKRVWLTSQPQSWLNYELDKDSQTLTLNNEEKIKVTSFKSELSSFSFGSAKHIANDFYMLEQQASFDMQNLLMHNMKDFLVKDNVKK